MGGRFANLPSHGCRRRNWRSAYAERGYPTQENRHGRHTYRHRHGHGRGCDLGLGCQRRGLGDSGSRLGAVEHGLASCESDIRKLRTEVRTDIRELNRKVDRILERLPPAHSLADSQRALSAAVDIQRPTSELTSPSARRLIQPINEPWAVGSRTFRATGQRACWRNAPATRGYLNEENRHGRHTHRRHHDHRRAHAWFLLLPVPPGASECASADRRGRRCRLRPTGSENFGIDVRDQGTRLHTDIQSVRTEVKAGNEGLRTEVKDNAQLVRTEVQDLRTEVKADVQLVRTEVQDLRTDVKADIQLVRTEVRDLRTEVKTDIQDLRSEVKADIQELRADVKTDIQELRTEVHADIGDLRSEVRQTNDKLDRILERLPQTVA